MKRLTKRLLDEINHEAELLAHHYLRSDTQKISRIAGPNYISYTVLLRACVVKKYIERPKSNKGAEFVIRV